MKTALRILACVLALLMLFGCAGNGGSDGKPQNDTDTAPKIDAQNAVKVPDKEPDPTVPKDEPEPEPIQPVTTPPAEEPAPTSDSPREVDVTVTYEYSLTNDELGHYISVTSPKLIPGCEVWGELPAVPELSIPRQEALRQTTNYLDYLTEADALGLKSSAQMHASDSGWFSVSREVFMTRCDEDYISFYVRSIMDDDRLDTETVRYYAVNIGKDGSMCNFHTAFSDFDGLDELIYNAFLYEYPFTDFYKNAREIIAESIDSGDREVTFALFNGGVVVLANPETISDEPEGHIIFMSFADYPELCLPTESTQADSFIVPMEYGVNYKPDADHSISIYWDLDEEYYDGFWTVSVNGADLTESFYGYSPECWLMKKDGEYFLYLRVPVGDVSRLGRVYRLEEDRLELVESTELVFADEMNYNTNRLLMLPNEYYYGEGIYWNAVGCYELDENGVPRLLSPEYKLIGTIVTPIETQRLFTDTGDFVTVAAGIWLEPLKTDRDSYLDFLAEDGRIIRVDIDRFGWDMLLFSDTEPDSFFKSVEEGDYY